MKHNFSRDQKRKMKLRKRISKEIFKIFYTKEVPLSEMEKWEITATPNPMFDGEKFVRSLDDPNFDFTVDETCCLCGAEITDFRDSHNPFPLETKETDRCCSKCDQEQVLVERLFSQRFKDCPKSTEMVDEAFTKELLRRQKNA